MPTSVLLAVLVAAGLLALAPALVRRYDVTERLEAERALSAARVLPRARRRRSVPGPHPINPPRALPPTLRPAAPPAGAVLPVDHVPERWRDRGDEAVPAGSAVAPVPRPRRPAPPPRRAVPSPRQGVPSPRRAAPPSRRPARPPGSPSVRGRRRVLAALALLNLVEVVGVAAVGPGFWVGFAVTATLLVAYLVHLRTLAVADHRRRQAAARRARWLSARQAEVRMEQERRAAARRAAARRMAGQRESLRRAAAEWSAPPTVSYRRTGGPGG